MASITDKFRKVSDGSVDFPNVARVDSPRSIAATTLVCDDLEGWAEDTAVDVLTYRLDTSNVVVPGTVTAWIAVVSGNNLTNFTYVKGAADAGHLANDVVQLTPQSNWSDDLVDGILSQHSQTGSHTAITATSLSTTGAVSVGGGLTVTGSVSLPNNSVEASDLSTSAITLGYAQITGNVSTNASTAALATGLTSAVTIPAGGRKVKVTVYLPYVQLTAGGYADVTIWDGTVGSGTQLQRWFTKLGDATVTQGVQMTFVHTPSAGSKTYNVGFTTGSGTTITINAGVTFPASILVEAI